MEHTFTLSPGLLTKLAHDLIGDLTKELDAVTIPFKAGVPSKYDLACRLICHDHKGHTIQLYTSGLASTPTLTIDLNGHRTSLVASTIVEKVRKIIASVTAKMPARNQVICATVPKQEPSRRYNVKYFQINEVPHTTRIRTNSRYFPK